MKLYLNAGFGEPLPASDIDLIASLGYAGIRQNVPSVETAVDLAKNALQSGQLEALFILPVEDPAVTHEIAHTLSRVLMDMDVAQRAALEVGNEEDLAGKRWTNDPQEWGKLVRDVASIAWQQTGGVLRVVSGGISSLSRTATGWLEKSRVRDLDVIVGYHQYRSTPPGHSLDGYSSRLHEFVHLELVSGGRPVWCTESGWHTAPRKEGCWPFTRRWAYTDEQVTEFLSGEITYNRNAGAGVFVVYQLNDGPNPRNDQDRFGIRRADGSLKPQANVAAGRTA